MGLRWCHSGKCSSHSLEHGRVIEDHHIFSAIQFGPRYGPFEVRDVDLTITLLSPGRLLSPCAPHSQKLSVNFLQPFPQPFKVLTKLRTIRSRKLLFSGTLPESTRISSKRRSDESIVYEFPILRRQSSPSPIWTAPSRWRAKKPTFQILSLSSNLSKRSSI